jgi:hypothetical protein
MSHEISHLTGRHRVFPAQPTVGAWTEIGRAEVVYTMFGKAKVRIIREQGENRRTGRLLMALAATALCAAAWQGWVASMQTEAAQVPDLPMPAATQVRQVAPAQTEYTTQPAMSPSVQNQAPARPFEAEKPPVSQTVVRPAVTAEEQPAAKPAVRRSKTDASQNLAVAAGDSGSDPTGKATPARLPSAKQPAAAAIVTPSIAKADAQAAAAAGSPAAKVPAMTPPINESSSLTAVDKQPAAPLRGQGQ